MRTGLDAHKKIVVACILVQTISKKLERTVRSFGTTTTELFALNDWYDLLSNQKVTHIEMESTGEYWKILLNQQIIFSVILCYLICISQSFLHTPFIRFIPNNLVKGGELNEPALRITSELALTVSSLPSYEYSTFQSHSILKSQQFQTASECPT